jgi:heme/copper-type cytochrome/quinol oxidase subunit 4
VLALAFGVLIVMRLIVASLWIMINEVALPRRS